MNAVRSALRYCSDSSIKYKTGCWTDAGYREINFFVQKRHCAREQLVCGACDSWESCPPLIS